MGTGAEILVWIAVVVVGVAVVLFLLAVVVFFVLRRRLRGLGAALEAAVGSNLPDFRVRLTPLTPFEWHDEAACEPAVTRLAAARFAESGRFTLEENQSARLVGLVNEDERLLAAVYELGASGPHIDVVGLYDDGRHLTVTNTADTGLDESDRRVTLRDPDADAATLVRTARDERPPGALVAVETNDFQRIFEETYAAEMDWRAARGGFNRSEITHAAHIQAELLDDDETGVDDATVDFMLTTFNGALFGGVDEALRERLEATTTMSVVEWEEARDRLVFVYDELPAAMLRTRLASCLPVDAGVNAAGATVSTVTDAPGVDDTAVTTKAPETAVVADLNADALYADLTDVRDRDAFAAALAAAPASPGARRARLFATVDRPFLADVYAQPGAAPPD